MTKIIKFDIEQYLAMRFQTLKINSNTTSPPDKESPLNRLLVAHAIIQEQTII